MKINPNAYIVVFKDRVTDPVALAEQLVATYGGKLRYVYQYALKGFAADLPDSAVAALRQHPDVAGVEPDNHVYQITDGRWGQTILPLANSFGNGCSNHGPIDA